MLSKKEFVEKYGASRGEMFILVGLLMQKDLYYMQHVFYLEGPNDKNELSRKCVKKLLRKKFIQQIGKSEYFTLTNDGFVKAYNKIKEFDGKVFNAPIRTQGALKNG